MTSTYETFVAFGTDIVGLERLLRFFQALFMILTSYPSLIAALLPQSPLSVHVSTETSLSQLQSRLNVYRRSMRLFRFLDSFNIGYKLYTSPSYPQGKPIEVWLEILAKSSLGVFGMLESITLVDLMGVDHLAPFGMKKTREINLQAQAFWFVGLYASVVITCIKLLRLFAYRSVPETGEVYGQLKNGEKTSTSVASSDNATSTDEKAQLKGAADAQKADRKPDVSKQVGALGIKLMSDVLDMVLPASALGWVHVGSGLVGIAMLCSTVTTSMDAWTRCRRQVDG